MKISEVVDLHDVMKSDQYIKLLHRLKTDVKSGIDVTHIKNQVISSWKSGMKSRKHYGDLLGTLGMKLNDLIH